MERIKDYVILGVVLVLIGFPTIQFLKTKRELKKQEDKITELQKDLINRDSLEVIKDGLYKKTVADLYTSKELTKELKGTNEILNAEVKRLKGSIIMLEEINFKLKNKKDTVKVVVGEIDKDRVLAFYPNSLNSLITFSREYQEDSYIDNWAFTTLKIDMVVIQEKTGKFSAMLNAPDWVELKSLNVKTIPLRQPKPDNFDWVTMISAQKNLGTSKKQLGLDLGIRYKKGIYTVGATTENDVKVTIGRLW